MLDRLVHVEDTNSSRTGLQSPLSGQGLGREFSVKITKRVAPSTSDGGTCGKETVFEDDCLRPTITECLEREPAVLRLENRRRVWCVRCVTTLADVNASIGFFKSADVRPNIFSRGARKCKEWSVGPGSKSVIPDQRARHGLHLHSHGFG